MKLNLVFMLGFALPLAMADCPDYEEEPVMYPYNTNLFLCADVYQGPGDDDEVQACNTCEDDGDYWGQFYVEDGEETPGEDGKFYPMGSIVIMPGCTFYGFSEDNYDGDVKQYDGPHTVELVHKLTIEDKTKMCGEKVYGYSSFMCECVQKLIECDPEDDYANAMTCDNLNGATTMDCEYKRMVGTSYTEEVSQSKGVSAGVEAEIEAGLGETFSAGLGISGSTSFDWTNTESSTFADSEEVTVTFHIPPGIKSVLDQVVGYCDGNESMPYEFRVTSVNATSGAQDVRYYTQDLDGNLREIRGDRGREAVMGKMALKSYDYEL